jgi:putative salt-induced outer membrane protein YdiY
MRHLQLAAALALVTTAAMAQDRITLTNGDVLTGQIKTMADGKVTIHSPVLGDVVVPMSDVSDMVTKEVVRLKTASGDLLQRRIVGLEGGNLRLEGDTTALSLENLGQINPPEKEEPSWTGSLKLTGIYASGNTDRRAAGLLFDATRRSEIDRITVDASWDYSEDKDGDPTSATFRDWRLNQRRVGGGLKYDYYLGERWYLIATARALGDTLADLQLRFTTGLGLGYTVVDDETTLFLVEAGLAYLSENYRSAAPSVDYVSARVAYRLEHELSADTKLVHRVEAFPSLESSDDIYLQAVTELTTSLTESMVASVSWILDYDNTPAPDRERADNRVLVGVGWSF